MAQTTGSLYIRAAGLLIVAALLTPVSVVGAQVGEPETGFPTGSWIEFDETKDWLRLTSGEWLRGDLNWMRNGDFEFDGDKTDLIREGWSDVDQLHSPQIKTYVFRNRVDATGRAMITTDEVIVETEEGTKTFPRSELLSIVRGGTRERDWWVFEIGAGFTGAFGNSSQSSISADFGLGRHDQRTSTILLYEGTYGVANGDANVNRHLGQAALTLYVFKRFYVVPADADFFHDRFANIRFRATPGALVGVEIFDTNRVEWDFECGLGYQFLRVISTEPNVPNPQSDGFVPVHTTFELEITGDIELILGWQSNIVFTTIGNTNHFGEATLKVEVTEIFNLNTEFKYFRTEQPIPREDGTVPARNDFQLIVGFTIEVG